MTTIFFRINLVDLDSLKDATYGYGDVRTAARMKLWLFFSFFFGMGAIIDAVCLTLAVRPGPEWFHVSMIVQASGIFVRCAFKLCFS